MSEREKPPLTWRERYKRSLAVNAFFGIDGASHCHDIPQGSHIDHSEPKEGEEFYIMSVNIETGELSFKPGNVE